MNVTWSRGCACGEALDARFDPSGTLQVSRADGHPLGDAEPCRHAQERARALTSARRVLRPRRRAGDSWEEVSWDEALRQISARLRELRKRHGPGALAWSVGAEAAAQPHTAARLAGVALSWGTPHVYGPLADGPAAAWLRACEWVTGTPWPLQSDLGRAHYVLLLSPDPSAGWGPLQGGGGHLADIAFSRKTKSAKLAVADARRSEIAAGADVHVAIRPGTELWFLLGLIDSVLRNHWRDVQYTDDYCEGLDALRSALAPWTLERCAAICGVPAPEIGAVALKFSRAAMAVAHRSAQALSGPHGTLTAWAILVLHAITANLLRPGGLYDSKALVDLYPLAERLPTAHAPRTASGAALVLGQAPPDALLTDVRAGGPRALLSLQDDPVSRHGPDLADALDLLVACADEESPTTERAHWVLPLAHPFEHGATRLFDGAILPRRALQRAEPVRAPAGEALPGDELIRRLHAETRGVLRGNAWGLPLRAAGAWLADADLPRAEARFLSALALEAAPGETLPRGEIDRATWRVRTPNGKLRLLPPEAAEAIAALRAPNEGEGAFFAILAGPAEREGAGVSPERGWAEGAPVRVRYGGTEIVTVVRHDARLRADAVDLRGVPGAALAVGATASEDPVTRARSGHGSACTLLPG